MPIDNKFRHQVYTNSQPESAYHLLQPTHGPELESDEFRQRMQLVGDRYRAAGVSDIYLVHGTFVGGDAAGLWTELSRVMPSIGDTLQKLSKKWIDTALGEQGNYTDQFAQLFEDSLNQGDERPIRVRLFHWSSENHHIGRADCAVRLIDELDKLGNPERILLWGHSHAGNVFALMTNLLAADEETIDLFFKQVRIFFRHPLTRRVDLPVWRDVWQRLKNESRPLAESPLCGKKCDFVTFGTPVRYGWDSRGYSRLLHFINHRCLEGLPDFLTRFPPTAEDVLRAADGDYVQHFGIAGTNVVPGLFSWRRFLADRRLNRLLQPNLRVRDLNERLKLGMRVPAEGTTLLCDYGTPEGNVAQHMAGHAAYTLRDWLLFHAEQTSAFLYESKNPAAAE